MDVSRATLQPRHLHLLLVEAAGTQPPAAPRGIDVVKVFAKRGTLRVELEDGVWVELHKDQKRHRPLPDHFAFIRATVAAVAASTNLADANGAAVDVTDPETWKRFSKKELIQLAGAAAIVVAADRGHLTEVLNGR